MIEMFYLVLIINYTSGAMTVMPEKYTKQQCEAAGRDSYNYLGKINSLCVPAPIKNCVIRMRAVPSMPQVMENYKDCE